MARSIPFVVRGGRGVLDEDEARFIRSFAALAARGEGNQEPMDVWRELMDAIGVSEDAHAKITNSAMEAGGGGGDVLEAVKKSRIKADNKKLLSIIIESIFQTRKNQAAGQASNQTLKFGEVLNLSGLVDGVSHIAGAAGRKAAAAKRKRGGMTEEAELKLAKNLANDRFNGIFTAISALKDYGLREASERMDLDEKMRTGGDDKSPKVVISTAHSAKGLEWDTVFVMDAADGFWPPSWGRGEGEHNIHTEDRKREAEDEEKRLFYVAVTRAKNRLFMVSAADMRQGGEEPVSPVPFLPGSLHKIVEASIFKASRAYSTVVAADLTRHVVGKSTND